MTLSKRIVFLATALSVTTGFATNTSSGSGYSLNADWFNQIVNSTPAASSECPAVDVDVNNAGYKVAMQTSFYGALSGHLSQWYPTSQIWTSIAIGPMVNSFGIIFTKVDSLDRLDTAKAKSLPLKVDELANWTEGDSAYWESQGGVTFYAGLGTGIVGIGTFGVATGGWANYLEKTGANTVYVEKAKTHIDSISLGVNVGPITANAEQVFETSKGLNFEFNLAVAGANEAFERFMAGDAAYATDMSRVLNSGVKKVADTNSKMTGRSYSLGIATPIIPIFSFKSTKSNDVNHEEEITSDDEIVVKDYGVYKKTKVLRWLLADHRKESTMFKGGVKTVTSPISEADKTIIVDNLKFATALSGATKTTEKLYGNFKYSYQSDFGDESKLNEKIKYAQFVSGLNTQRETCVSVPSMRDSLKYNQVILEMNLSDEYIREIIGNGRSGAGFLDRMQARAKNADSRARMNINCNTMNDGESGSRTVDPMCQVDSVDKVFSKLKKSAIEIRAGLSAADRKGFSQAMADFGKAVWQNPSVFSTFYETGMDCGVELKFEVSGQRITRFQRAAQHTYKSTCQ
jgi:hypothetical protein